MVDAYWFGQREENGLVYAGNGTEPGWRDGEDRTVAHPERIRMAVWGYHAATSWLRALRCATGPIACRVQLEAVAREDDILVGPRRVLLCHVDASHELRLFAADTAERALMRERTAGREPDPRSWRAVEAARKYAREEIDDAALRAAADAAGDVYVATYATVDGPDAAANAAAGAAAGAAYAAAAGAAADAAANANAIYAAACAGAAYASAEREWQAERLAYWIDLAFARVGR